MLRKYVAWWTNAVPLPLRVASSTIGVLTLVSAVIWLLSGEKTLLIGAVNAYTWMIVCLFAYGLYRMIKDIFSDVRSMRKFSREAELRQIVREEICKTKSGS